MIGTAIGLLGLGWVGSGSLMLGKPLFEGYPELVLTTSVMVMFFALILGTMMATINIPAQTVVQERSNDAVRGRVFAAQFTLSNAIAIPPMLFLGNLADRLGIPYVTVIVAILITIVAILNLVWAISMVRLARHRHAKHLTLHSDTTKPAP